ncbi:MAG: PQQ-binding-like beta-propeller repeat protein [Acidobacteria bacterium]|nr:PQQ-binding-like beta-propeller repeat protein [Acidobacteriota bacterium]
MTHRFIRLVLTLAAIALLIAPWLRASDSLKGTNVDWGVYRGDPGAGQYSALAQIHAANVHRLEPAWVYRTGDATPRSTMHVNPVVIDGVMYVTTPSMRAVALDAATGRERWTFDPAPHNDGTVVRLRNRGLAYWKGNAGERIFHFVRERVYALDAASGQLVTSFGENGYIDLREHLGVDPASVFVEMTSPGAIYANFLIVGSRVNESYDASPGHIRAYDTVTGQLRWIFHTIPQPGEVGHETWQWVDGEPYGGANAWGGITVDEKRGWVFCATGSATEDFYGGFRKGQNLFANTVLALDASTGERKWHFQTVRHDIWDYDNPPAPILVTLTSGGTARDVVVQLTKMGYTFVLDRDTGEPVFPVHEMPVPHSTVPGEETWPTQPVPIKPAPLVRQALTEADLTSITPESRAYALQEFRKYVSGPIYTPPTLQGTLTTPGHLGGSEWSGGSFDPMLNVLYTSVNDAPTINRLRPVHDYSPGAADNPAQLGRRIYERNCVACHGTERQGVPPHTPALLKLGKSRKEIDGIILEGRNSMPAFRQFRPQELNALAAYLATAPGEIQTAGVNGQADRYTIDGYVVFTDQHGVPAIAPPWGTLNAVDLVKGEILWKVPLGEYPQLVEKGIRNTGTMNYGGAVATAGGVIFIAATADEKIRAFEKHSGRVLWEYQLPAGGYATPSVYMVNGRQYVAIAAGGSGKNATKSGDTIMAFALPQAGESRPDSGRGATSSPEWIELFDGKTLDGWVHMNGGHRYTVEDGAIVGRTVESSAHMNSFLCTTREFDDFELELETTVDRITNQGIQIRSQVRPVRGTGKSFEVFPGRVYGPQVEVRRFYPEQPTTGLLYGEALGTGWLSSQTKIDQGHRHFIDEGWNKLRIVANGPRIQTWVNGQPVEDLVNEAVYRTHPKGFIGLQVHGLSEREINTPIHAGSGVTPSQPMVMKWRNIRIRPLRSAR